MLGWLLNLGFAAGTEVTTPAVLGDLTTLYAAYLETLLPTGDISTDVMAEYETYRANDVTDLNTAYAIGLS